MQIKRLIATLAVVTAATFVAGAASTAGNSTPDNGVAGYDAATVSGINVSTINYNVSSTDASKLASIAFVTTDLVNAPGTSGTLTINGSTNTQILCGAPVADNPTTPTKYTYTCDTTGQAIDLVTTIGFTVTKDGTDAV